MADWTPEMIERARALAATGLSYNKIGERMGVSKNAVVGIAKRNGFPPRGNVIGLPWTPAEDEIVRDCCEIGLSDGEIAGRLGTRARGAVQNRRYILGLAMDNSAKRRAERARAITTRRNIAKRQRSASEQRWTWGGPAPQLPKPVKALRVIHVCEPVAIEDNAGCCWPVTERRPWLVCGAPRAGRRGLCAAYCEGHARLAVGAPDASIEAAA